MTTDSPPRAPSARRVAAVVFAVFALNGVTWSSFASRLPAVRDLLGLTPGQMGLLLLAIAAGSVVALPLSGPIAQRIGSAATTRLGGLLLAIGFTGGGLALLTGRAPLVGAAFFLGATGIALWDVSMNIQGAAVEHHLGKAIMPRFHAGWSLGAVAGGALGALAARLELPVSAHVIAVVLVASTTAAVLTRHYLPDAPRGEESAPGESRAKRLGALGAWREPRTVLIGVMVLSASLAEGGAFDWLALAVAELGAGEAAGAAALSLFVAAQTVMRFAGTRLLDAYGRVVMLRIQMAAAMAGLALFGLADPLPLVFAGVVLWGFGAALGFPVGMSAAADDPVRAASRVAVVSTIAYCAFLAGPPLLGLLADRVGYRGALLVILAPLVLGFALAGVARPLAGSARDGGGRERVRPARGVHPATEAGGAGAAADGAPSSAPGLR